jgi:NADPH:quinone reductase-like Zn-dependent oxidoreductase
MKAAVVGGPGQKPQYTDFPEPVTKEGEKLVSVRAAALSHFTKGRASGAHYSSDGMFPAVAGADGVGVTQDGRRVYFVLPEAPNGAMAETTVVRSSQCVDLPADIDDVTAAAIANPGMSAWAALMERAHLLAGETVLINGATGTAGRLAVQIAKHLGASKVIATGRDAEALEEVRGLGADVVIPFDLDSSNNGPSNLPGSKHYEAALKEQFAAGINVVVDYLWGKSAETVIVAIAKAIDDATPVRFVHVGGASGGDIELPGAALRSSAIVLMGSGNKSIPLPRLLASIKSVFDAFVPARLRIKTKVVPLAEVRETWDDNGKSRIVFVLP